MRWLLTVDRQWPTDYGRGPMAYGLMVRWRGRVIYYRVDRMDPPALP